ncbi:NTF2-like protein [Martensiomyces pterosporus]|nr:NTF2-like protein [Martensiomyces pterosporus]
MNSVASAAQLPTQQKITQSINHAEKFVEQYYRSWSKSVGKFYQDTTKVIWNGQGFSGAQFKQDILPQLQTQLTNFDVRGYDVHQLGDESMIINVVGLVKLNKPVQFTQNFVVVRAGGLSYIQGDCFRLV